MIRRYISRRFAQLLKDLGLEYRTAEADGDPRRYLLVLLDVDGERVPVGRLWEEDGAYVFKYERDVRDRDDVKPISAFPDFGGEYRQEVLFPFFAVRIPPPKRADVKEALARRDIDPNDTLRVLGELARRSPTSPYIFEYHDEREDGLSEAPLAEAI